MSWRHNVVAAIMGYGNDEVPGMTVIIIPLDVLYYKKQSTEPVKIIRLEFYPVGNTFQKIPVKEQTLQALHGRFHVKKRL